LTNTLPCNNCGYGIMQKVKELTENENIPGLEHV